MLNLLKNIKPVVFYNGGETELSYSCEHGSNQLIFSAKNSDFTDKICIKKVQNGFIAKREITNISSETIKLKELMVRIEGINFNCDLKNDYYYSTENLRLFENITIPVDFDRIALKSFNGAREFSANTKSVYSFDITPRINAVPYLPFPAILLSNYNTNLGVIHGSLSQKVFYHNYVLSHVNNGIQFDIYSSFKSIDYREFSTGETLIDEWFIGKTCSANDYNGIFDVYLEQLRKYLANARGKGKPNRNTLVWDSWNDGIYRDVSESMLLEEAKAIKKYFPNVEFFQLDDGYSSYCLENVDLDAHGLGVPYEGEQGVDYKKFPNGLKGYTDKVKALGLRPAIWVGTWVPVNTKLYKEHTDWFYNFFHRIDFAQILDVSKKEVREYMLFAIRKLVQEYGFEGLKLDFWSYAFEESKNNLALKEKSGYELRDWWESEIVKLIPSDGYVETGCDISLGNPFIGEYFNNYRFGIDIGSGRWSNLLFTLFWASACLSTHAGDLFIPNSDSIGILPGLNDTDFNFWINYVLITRTMVEISGRFSRVSEDNARLKVLQKATCCINNGEKVYFAGFDYRRMGMLSPEIIYLNSPFFARKVNDGAKAVLPVKTVGIFNTSEKEKTITINLSELGLSKKNVILTDVWSGEKISVDSSLSVKLMPHGSRLFTVFVGDFGVLESDIGLINANLVNNELCFNVDYAKSANLKIVGNIQNITFNGANLEYTLFDGNLAFDIQSKGEIKIKFK